MDMLQLVTKFLRAWRTLEPDHWSQFADAWRRDNSRRYLHWLIAGQALKAAERFEDARDAFIKATSIRPTGTRAFLGLGQALKNLGERSAAIEAFRLAYETGAHDAAARQLCRYGARDHVEGLYGNIFPVRAYGEFIGHCPPKAPPALSKQPPFIEVHLDARGCRPDDLNRTIESLRAQAYGSWTCTVVVDSADIIKFPPPVPAELFNIVQSPAAAVDDDGWHLQLPAGAILDPHALSWFGWTISEVARDAVYADYDHYRIEGESVQRCKPVFHPMADPVWFADKPALPGIVANRRLRVSVPGPSAHIPRILASLPLVDEPKMRTMATPSAGQGRIAVVIPTRDNPELLKRCVETLFDTVAQRDRIQLRIVDNASVMPETHQLFATLKQNPSVAIVPFDEGFNWSRANNLGARDADQEHLLFLNDDTEMRTPRWDEILAGFLEHANTGIVGARLLYPSGAIQHAGFVFGMDNGPQHEGRWMNASEGGSDGRWRAARCAAAVTGAFMAMSRRTFEKIGPFDEKRFAVDFSDIDMCLRAREVGLHVVYAPQLELMHHESVSRGHNRSRQKRARARAEYAALKARWGNALNADPGYNPSWTREGCSFDGFREPSSNEIMNHIRRSARGNPWCLP